MVQVPAEVAHDVALSFQLDGREPVPDLLPALEQVKVYFPPNGVNGDDQYASICDAFEPLIAARKQMGRPVTLSQVITFSTEW